MSQERILLLSMDLGNKNWRLCFSDGSQFRQVSIPARDQERLLREVEKARKKFQLEKGCRIVSCYEAGRDGFWIHRFLEKHGIENRVVDPSSIEVDRKRRRCKTDRLDAERLMQHLIRLLLGGERKALRVVRVPSREEEGAMRIYRAREKLKKEWKSHLCRMKELLVLHGIVGVNPLRCRFEDLRDWEGQPLPAELIWELNREQERLALVREQLNEVEGEQRKHLKKPRSRAEQQGQQLTRLLGVGVQSSWALGHEYLGWRQFRNRKQVGACAGLVGVPYSSGDSRRDLGISKAGNKRIRYIMIELAWSWLYYQPGSALSRWYEERFGGGTRRMRRIGIVALARKLLVALWKYIERGEIPEGSVLGGELR